MTENYKQLLKSLKRFRSKFLIFELLRGLLFLFTIVIVYFLVLVFFEYTLFLSPDFKTFLFYFSLFFLLFSLFWLILWPVGKVILLGKLDSEKKIALLVKKFLPEMDDSIINAIELAQDNSADTYSMDLVWAGIDQKISSFKLLDFSKVLTIGFLKKQLIRFLLSLVLFLGILFVYQQRFFEPVSRLIHYQTEFIKPAPFQFILKTNDLRVRKGSSLKIELKLEGRKLPETASICFGGNTFLMKKNENLYSYEIENINNSFAFYFKAENFHSKQCRIEIMPVPSVLNFSVEVIPPSYTGLSKQSFSNIGDLKLAQGSQVKWNFNCLDTDSLFINIDSVLYCIDNKSDEFIFDHRINRNLKYSLSLRNSFFTENNVLQYSVEVIPDLYPAIEVVQLKDSVRFTRFYFKGKISDDYGFSNLIFHLNNGEKDSIIDIPFVKSLSEQDFYFTCDFSDFIIENESFEYHFSVLDNDVLHGYKETSSEVFHFKMPDKKEQQAFEGESMQALEKMMQESLELNADIKSDINQLKISQINGEMTDWEKQQKVQDIVEKREKLENLLDQISDKNKELDNFKNSFSEEKQEILQKQKELEELLNEVMSDELKKLFEEFNKLAQDFKSDKFDQLNEKMDMQLDDLSKQLDRNLQMFRRLKITQKIEEIIGELKLLSEKEKGFSKDYKKILNDSADFKIQKQIKDQIKLLIDDYSSVNDLNSTLKKPFNLYNFDDEFDEIRQNITDLLELVKKEKKNTASKKAEESAVSMDNLAFAMQKMLDTMNEKQTGEDIDNIRQLLDNLVYLSVFQERVMDRLKAVREGDPAIISIKKEQLKIIDQTKMVGDSLYALAERNITLSSVVNKELMNTRMYASQSLENMEESRNYNAVLDQQNTMMALNNLALFISEVVKQMEDQLKNQMGGDSDCNKPGKGKKQSMDLLKQSQESIKKQLQQMIEKMKSGSTQGMSKEIGQTLAQQEIMQQLIREMMGDKEVGSSAKEQLKMVDQLLEQNKLDLISKNISSATLNRQSMILNKLLEAEMAEMERDTEDKRESNTATEQFYSNPDLFFEYKREKRKIDEPLPLHKHKLEDFYEKKYQNYLKELNK